MEVYEYKRFGLKYKQIWFNNEDQFDFSKSQNADIVEFKESYIKLDGLYPFANGIVNLSKGLDVVYDLFEKGFKYEVRRAQKENFTCAVVNIEIEEELKRIYDYYKSFSIKKKIPFIKYDFFKTYFLKQSLIITVVKIEGTILQYHIYYLSQKELILLASFPLENITIINRSSQGFANRYLHWFDIQLTHHLNKDIYNLGGIGNTNDPSILSISKFKKEMSPDTRFYYQGVVPITFKGKLFFSIKRKINDYVKSNKSSGS